MRGVSQPRQPSDLTDLLQQLGTPRQPCWSHARYTWLYTCNDADLDTGFNSREIEKITRMPLTMSAFNPDALSDSHITRMPLTRWCTCRAVLSVQTRIAS